MAVSPEDIRIPAELRPVDGRFGAGPSKVRKEQADALASVWQSYLGTSHRQKTVRSQVGRLRAGLELPRDPLQIGPIGQRTGIAGVDRCSCRRPLCAGAPPREECPACLRAAACSVTGSLCRHIVSR